MGIAENNGRSTRLGGVTRKGFMPGQSGNPGGRPKGLARAVRELVGDDPHELVAILIGIAKDPTARNADRIAAVKEIFDRGYGKAPAVSPSEEYDPLELDELAAEALAIVDELAQRRNGDGASTQRQR